MTLEENTAKHIIENPTLLEILPLLLVSENYRYPGAAGLTGRSRTPEPSASYCLHLRKNPAFKLLKSRASGQQDLQSSISILDYFGLSMEEPTSTEIFPLGGGCACGHVRYRLDMRPLVVHCCHCTSCQRETGTAFAINAVVESEFVVSLSSKPPTVPASSTQAAKPAGPPLGPHEKGIVEPEIVNIPSETGKGQQVARCPKCLVAVWSHYGGAVSLTRFVRVGTLDEAWKVQPEVHIYTRSKRDFFILKDSIPQYEAFYPRKEDVWRKDSLIRWGRLMQRRDAM